MNDKLHVCNLNGNAMLENEPIIDHFAVPSMDISAENSDTDTKTRFSG